MPFDPGYRWTRPHIYAYTSANVFITNWVGIDPDGNWRLGYFPASDGWPDYQHGLSRVVLPGGRFPFHFEVVPWDPP